MNDSDFDDNIIIGISGKKRTGKDTVADRICGKYYFNRASFADPIKESASLIFGFTEEQLRGDKKEVVDPVWGFTPRWAMQQIGTDLFRENIDKEVWVKSMKRRILTSTKSFWVIPDVRFPNEMKAIKDMGGYMLKVRRMEKEPDLTWWKKKISQAVPSLSTMFGSEYHASEIALDHLESHNWNSTLYNDGTLDELYDSVDRVMESILVQEKGKIPF